MLVKFGYDLDKCIELYQLLSKEIFGHTQLLGRWTLGLGQPRYSGNHMRQTVVDEVIKKAPDVRNQNADYSLEEILTHEDFCCAVVCREEDDDTDEAVFLCSHRDELHAAVLCHHSCRHADQKDVLIKVADAARATSAAPTYFDPVMLLNKSLVDGGFGWTNNPSKATWNHYFELRQKNYEQVRFVNLGTGSKPKGYTAPKPEKSWTNYLKIPALQNAKKLMKRLQDMATDSDQVGWQMRSIELAGNILKFARFSADKGDIHLIQLHEYERNDDIKAATKDYIDNGVIVTLDETLEEKSIPVKDALMETARHLAETYQTRIVEGRRKPPVASHNHQRQAVSPVAAASTQAPEVDQHSSHTSADDEQRPSAPENTREPTPQLPQQPFQQHDESQDHIHSPKITSLTIRVNTDGSIGPTAAA